jgi:hypothetical protein
MSRARRLRGNLVGRNVATDSADYSFPCAYGKEAWVHHITPIARHEKLTDRRIARLLGGPGGIGGHAETPRDGPGDRAAIPDQ